jgi:hypothetical protein
MDRNRFDNLARTLAEPATRRTALAIAGRTIAAALGLTATRRIILPDGADAASCRALGGTCSSNASCCSGVCDPKDSRGRRRCGCSEGEKRCGNQCIPLDQCCGTCPDSPDGCGLAACIDGACGFVQKCTSADPCAVATCSNGVCGATEPACPGCSGCFGDSAGNAVCMHSSGFVTDCYSPCSVDSDCDPGWYCLNGNRSCSGQKVCVAVPICTPS